MRAVHRGSIAVVALVAALVTTAGGPASAAPADATPPAISPGVDAPVPPSPADPAHPIDDPALLAATGSAPVRDQAPASQQATVEVTHDADDDQVVQRIAALGGSSIVAVGDDLVQAEVPVRSLDALALSPGITYVRKAIANKVDPGRLDRTGDAARPQVGSHSTSGVAITGANAWQSAGITGAGVKIGILDYFSPQWAGMQAAGDVPAPAGVRCLDSVGAGLCPGGTNTVFDASNSGHGNAVAETIHDMAPGATLYLATSASTADDQRIVDWFHANGVTIISTSLGWIYDGPGNGTGPEDAVVARAASYGMAWVTAAGNQGSGAYWRGNWSDTNSDRYLEFAPGDEFLDIASDNGGGVCPPGTSLLWLAGGRWNDWGSPSTRSDLTFEIWSRQGSSYTLWTRDASNQNTGASPIELAGAESCVPGQPAIRVRYTGGPSPAGDVIELLSWYGTPEHAQAAFSATTPVADSPYAITVGAIDPAAGTSLAGYSSRGPTNDGRMKPDLSAPSCFSSSVFTPCFNGTSAATPVVSGAAALIMQKHLVGNWAALAALLRHDVIDRGAAGPDSAYGAGELCLGVIPQPGGDVHRPGARPALSRPPRRVRSPIGSGAPDGQPRGGAEPTGARRPRQRRHAWSTSRSAGTRRAACRPMRRAVVLNVTVVRPDRVRGSRRSCPPTGRRSARRRTSTSSPASTGRTSSWPDRTGRKGVDLFEQRRVLRDRRLGYFTPKRPRSVRSPGRRLTPRRVLDTRASPRSPPRVVAGRLGGPQAGSRRDGDDPPAQRAGIPATAAAADGAEHQAVTQAAGRVSLPRGPAARAAPANSNFNLAGATIADLVVVPSDAGSTVSVFTSSAAHV